MVNVTEREAKKRFEELLDRVSEGEEVVITRDKEPIARIVREARRSSQSVKAAVAGLRELQAEIRKRTGGETLSHLEIRSAIEEGRI